MPGRGRGAPEDEEAWADRATDQAPRRPLEHIPPQGISRITTAAIPAPVKATAPRCSIRLTAASIILASWHSRMRAFGQRLTAASYVALASMKSWTPANWSTISPLSSTSSTLCLKWLRNKLVSYVGQRGNGSLRAITPLLQAHEPETVQVRLRIKGITIIRVHDDAAEKRPQVGGAQLNSPRRTSRRLRIGWQKEFHEKRSPD